MENLQREQNSIMPVPLTKPYSKSILILEKPSCLAKNAVPSMHQYSMKKAN